MLFTKNDLAQLYRARWNAELDLRSLKRTLQMDVLRCKTPELVRKEIWTHILAYNLIRTIMAQAATKHGIDPRSISFKGAVQTLEAFQPVIAIQGEHDSSLPQAAFTSSYSTPSLSIASPTDPIGTNHASESGDPNTTAFSGNHDGRPNVICAKALPRTKCHSSHRPMHKPDSESLLKHPRLRPSVGVVPLVASALLA